MIGILLLIPFFLIRFGLLFFLNKGAIKRAGHFAPLENNEKAAYWVYQSSNAAIVISLFFLELQVAPPVLFYAGAITYALGTMLLIAAVVSFAAPSENGMNKSGLYRLSRNPMYAAYFLYFMGCVLLTQSLLLLGFVLAFQISAHWIILAEERWCVRKFGSEYLEYIGRVRRYF